MGRRHLTTAITLLVLVGILGVGLLLGMQNLTAPIPSAVSSASPSPSCAPQTVNKGERLRSAQVVVSVYNAGTRAGLADETLQGLARRGFQSGELGNAPGGAKLRFVQVWTTDRNDAAARLVAAQFGRKTLIKVVTKDLGPGIDVLVGSEFKGLVKAPHSVRVRTGQRVDVCS